jgi:hypothetical protein
MLLQLDVRTLLVALFASFSLAAVCLAYVWRFTKTHEGFGIWVGTMGLISLGQFLLAGRGVLPDPVSISTDEGNQEAEAMPGGLVVAELPRTPVRAACSPRSTRES